MPNRLAEVGDLWSDMRRRGRSLKQPLVKLRQLMSRQKGMAEPS
jgi:hypothetical protein